jgi:CheY-like chemotaxis protein
MVHIIAKDAPMKDYPTVLIVDDNRVIRETLRDVLHLLRPHWWLVEASNGLEAVEIAFARRPDLILLDFNMPLMDGYEVALTLRGQDQTKTIPIIVITSEDSDHLPVKRLRALCQSMLHKPFTIKDLEEILDRIFVMYAPIEFPAPRTGYPILNAVAPA